MAVLPRWAVVLMAGAALLGGCSGGSDSSRPQSGANPRIGGSGCCMEPMARGPFVVPGASKGGTVTVLTHDGLQGTLDPSEVYQPDLLSIDRGLLMRSLTQYRYDAFTHQMVLVPDLATDLGTHNDDYTGWLYTIRDGVRFENGERVTADDVVRGIRRCMHPATFPTGPCQYYANVYIRTVQAKGDTIKLLMKRPFPDLPYFGTIPERGPLPAGRSLDPTAYRRRPLATGPYRIARYRPGREMVLTRNPEWEPATDPARTQYPDGYVFRAGVPTRTIERTLEHDHGTGRTTLPYDNLSPHAFTRMRALAPDRVVLGSARLACTTYAAPDNRAVRKPLVRRALALAYTYRAVIRLEGGIPGVTALPAAKLMPPGVVGRTPLTAHQASFRTDALAARSLLRRAHALGFELGFELSFSFDPQMPESVRTMDALVRALRRGGFRARPVEMVGGLAISPANVPDVSLRTTTLCRDWPSGTSWIAPLAFPGRNAAHFSAPPGLRHRIARVPRLPSGQQPEVWNRLDDTIMSDFFPMIPLSYGAVDLAHGSRVRGMAGDNTLGMPTWQRIWVSP